MSEERRTVGGDGPQWMVPHADRMWGQRYALRNIVEDSERHSHSMGFFACIESGVMELQTAAGSWVLPAGTVTYVPAGFAHKERGISPELVGWVLYLPQIHGGRFPARPCLIETTRLLNNLCERIVSWDSQQPRSASQHRLTSVALDELLSARRSHFQRMPLPRHPRVAAVAARILNDPQDMRGIDAWARHAGVSRRTFTRCFVRETGLSFVQWRQRVKLQASLRALAHGRLITDIALDLGYRSTAAFSAMFRKQFGVSPTQYVCSVLQV